jgi:hypothetical protein
MEGEMAGGIYSVESHGEFALKDLDVCKSILEHLEKDYPGHPWLAYADTRAGWAAIKLGYVDKNGRVAGEGMLLRPSDFDPARIVRTIRNMAGELLERQGLRARGFKIEDRFIALDHGLDRSGIGKG